MESKPNNVVLQKILEDIDIPDGAYELAENRYKDIGDWLHREGSNCAEYSPHVFAQGSFRLGTAIKPLQTDHYDLDMSCSFADGIRKESATQEQLKTLLGSELEVYRKARNIRKPPSEKRRCWRLEYADSLNFHIDVVPSIPEGNSDRVKKIQALLVEHSMMDEELALRVVNLNQSITDNTDENYHIISSDWRLSNPEGYAKWFESKMRLARDHLNKRELLLEKHIEELPYYKWKTPLQQVTQLLKRHRDQMYGDDEGKPISIIITTLAARAYRGESSLDEAVKNILSGMESQINLTTPYVPNPVNPSEDFADKWDEPEYAHLHLRDKFKAWLTQAKADIDLILDGQRGDLIVEAARKGFNVAINKSLINPVASLAVDKPNIIEQSAPRPWTKDH